MGARRTTTPLLLSLAGLAGLVMGWPLLAALVLFTPGWGMTRLVSVLDRAFGVAGSALCLSWIVLGAGAVCGAALGWTPARIGFVIQLLAVALCLWGRIRLVFYDRWLAAQPPHPDPMPLWPARTGACLVVLGAALLAVLRVAPLDQFDPAGGALEDATRAVAWLEGGRDPLDATRTLDAEQWPSAVVAGVVAATGLPAPSAVRLVCLSALAAALFLISEAVSRLLGNQGATRAMLALLLGLNPLAVVFLLLGDPTAPAVSRMAPELAPSISTALSPFVQGV